jgi:hypothetical protein
MRRVLAIDPGNTESAWCVIDADTFRPQSFAKEPNADVLDVCELGMPVAIEMVASYGMPVGRDVFETCVWVGRFIERHEQHHAPLTPLLVYRRDIKLHHCGSARAKDANITQALVDRFAHGQPNRGKGTKAEPGWFHGFKADIWQAYALAVYAADTAQEDVA